MEHCSSHYAAFAILDRQVCSAEASAMRASNLARHNAGRSAGAQTPLGNLELLI